MLQREEVLLADLRREVTDCLAVGRGLSQTVDDFLDAEQHDFLHLDFSANGVPLQLKHLHVLIREHFLELTQPVHPAQQLLRRHVHLRELLRVQRNQLQVGRHGCGVHLVLLVGAVHELGVKFCLTLNPLWVNQKCLVRAVGQLSSVLARDSMLGSELQTFLPLQLAFARTALVTG